MASGQNKRGPEKKNEYPRKIRERAALVARPLLYAIDANSFNSLSWGLPRLVFRVPANDHHRNVDLLRRHNGTRFLRQRNLPLTHLCLPLEFENIDFGVSQPKSKGADKVKQSSQKHDDNGQAPNRVLSQLFHDCR